MKKYPLSILLFLSIQYIIGQTDSVSIQKKQPSKQDRLIIDLFHDNWLNIPDSIKTKWYSYGVAVSMLYDYPVGNGNFSFAGGADIACHNVRNNAKLTEQYDSTTSGLFSVFVPYTAKYKKNKLSTNYADAVAELRFRTNPDKRGYSWKFSIGGRYGYLVNVHDMYKDATGKYKTYIFPNVTQQRYGAHFRAAYGRVALFGFYSLTNLFEKKKGIEIVPFSVGVSVMPM